MTTLFLTCAAIGGTVLLLQFVLSLIGLSDSGADFADDLPAVSDVHLEVGHAGGGDVTGDGAHDGLAHDGTGHSHISDWLFGVISFRTVVAALTFFGLSGMAAHSAHLDLGKQLAIAMTSGLAAMYAMHALMRGMAKLAQDGTLRIERAIGKTGTVYLPIPANRANTGKIQISLQGRLEEFNAVTPVGARLPAGAKVVVTGVISGDTLEVEPLPAQKPSDLATEAV